MKEFQARLIVDVVTGKLDVRDATNVMSKQARIEKDGEAGEAVHCRGRGTEAEFRETAAYSEMDG